MKHIEAMMKSQERHQHPGHLIGAFLLSMSNSPKYLVGQLEAYLEAATADLLEESSLESRMLYALLHTHRNAEDRVK